MTIKQRNNNATLVGFIFLTISIIICINILIKLGKRPFPKPRENNVQTIESWMTFDYISKTYGIPMHEIKNKLIYKFEPGKKSIEIIAKENNVDSKDIINDLQEIIVEFQKKIYQNLKDELHT